MAQSKDALDMIFEKFGPISSSHEESVQLEPVTFWLPVDYKNKYDEIQSRTKRKFGKLLKEVLKKSIDKVNMESI